MRGSSQNARFAAVGIGVPRLAEALAAGLRERGVEAAQPEPWRGVGFRIACPAVEITLAACDGQMTLQVAGSRELHFGERLRAGRHPDAAACYAVAAAVHETLAAEVPGGVRWRWDGPPDDGDPPRPTPEPTADPMPEP